jgi:hypothetical protein
MPASVEVLILIEMLFAEGRLAVEGLWLAEFAGRLEAVGAEVGEHVLDSPESICPRFDLQPHDGAGLDEMILRRSAA